MRMKMKGRRVTQEKAVAIREWILLILGCAASTTTRQQAAQDYAHDHDHDNDHNDE